MGYGELQPRAYGTHDGEMERLFHHIGAEDIDAVHFGFDDNGLDCKFFGATASKYVLWDESADTWYFGQDDVGIDVKFFGASGSSYMEWDESEDQFNVVVSSSRAVTGEDYGISVTYGGTLSSADSVVGVNVAITTAGTAGTWVSGIYAKVTQGTTQNVSGYICGAEFEVINTCAAPSHLSCLVLDANNSGGASEFGSYIDLRDYGTNEPPLFLWAPEMDASTHGAGGDAKIWSTVASDSPCDRKLAIRVGTTAYWIMCTTEKPSTT